MLTDEEKQELTNYTGVDATRINKAIRLDDITEEIQKKINLLDSALEKSKPLDQDIIVHRGTIIQSIAGFEKRKQVSYEKIMDLKYIFIQDRAFFSASRLKAEENGRNIIMKIRITKGFKGALDIELYALEKYKYQKEVLVKRNIRFFINNIEFEAGKYYFDMEIIE